MDEARRFPVEKSVFADYIIKSETYKKAFHFHGRLFVYSRLPNSGRVRETKRRPEWNPQRGLCPLEENSEFQGFLADGTRLFIPLLKQVEILIST